MKVRLLGPGGVAINDSSIRLTTVTLDGSPALSPGSSQPDFAFIATGGGWYEFKLKSTGLKQGLHTLAYSVTGDPLRHTIVITVQ